MLFLVVGTPLNTSPESTNPALLKPPCALVGRQVLDDNADVMHPFAELRRQHVHASSAKNFSRFILCYPAERQLESLCFHYRPDTLGDFPSLACIRF